MGSAEGSAVDGSLERRNSRRNEVRGAWDMGRWYCIGKDRGGTGHLALSNQVLSVMFDIVLKEVLNESRSEKAYTYTHSGPLKLSFRHIKTSTCKQVYIGMNMLNGRGYNG
jgi:hypothetical protein